MDVPLAVVAEQINLLQVIVSIIMFFVLCFGVGFILNMILKTTWLPLILYLIIAVILLFRLEEYLLPDIAVLISGLFGAIGGGWTIQALRAKGYKMF